MQQKGKGKGGCRRWRWGGTIACPIPVACRVPVASPLSCTCLHVPVPIIPIVTSPVSCPHLTRLPACIILVFMPAWSVSSCPHLHPHCLSCPYPVVLVMRSGSLSSLIPCCVVLCCLRCCKNIVSG
jgi:hypothetical protein